MVLQSWLQIWHGGLHKLIQYDVILIFFQKYVLIFLVKPYFCLSSEFSLYPLSWSGHIELIHMIFFLPEKTLVMPKFFSTLKKVDLTCSVMQTNDLVNYNLKSVGQTL